MIFTPVYWFMIACHHMLSLDLTLVHDSYYPTNALVQLQNLLRIHDVNNSK